MNKIKSYFDKINFYFDCQKIRGTLRRLWIYLDIVWCYLLYGSSISDYFKFRFYEKKHIVKKEFITCRDKNRLYAAANDNSVRKTVQDKDQFNALFEKYLKREFIVIPDENKAAFVSFAAQHKSLFAKPISTGGGEGIVKIENASATELEKLYDDLTAKGKYVVEDCINQNKELAAVHPQSVNTARIVTFRTGDVVDVKFAVIRFGVDDSPVDNHLSGGLGAHIDIDSGRVVSLASSLSKYNVIRHPNSNVILPGFQLPFWNQAVEMVKEAALIAPKGVRYIGWDVAFLEDGCCIVEANPGAEFSLLQETVQRGYKDMLYQMIEMCK